MLPRLHLVTDDAVLALDDFAERAAAVLGCCGVNVAVHVRGRNTSGRKLHDVAQQLSEMALRTGAWLLVNDRIDVARAVRANGVQLTRRSLDIADARLLLGAHAAVGMSVHGVQEAAEAAALGADWLFAGTIWQSASHPERDGAGAGFLAECVSHSAAPVLAIGGVTPARVAEAARAGAWGVAVLGGVWHAADPAAAAQEYVAAVAAQWESREA